MKFSIVFFIFLIIFFPSCSEDDIATNSPPPPVIPDTITTNWGVIQFSFAKTGILDLTPFKTVDVNFQVDFNQSNTYRQEYVFDLSFPKYSHGIIYDGLFHPAYQTTNSKKYHYSIEIKEDFGFSTFYVSKADSVYFEMSFQLDSFRPDSITFSNLLILGYKN